MDPLLDQLHDIEGLDPISAWPLAIGWWCVLGLACILLFFFLYLLVAWVRYKRSWKSDTLHQLALLEKNLTEETARETVMTLSEYVRRIAVRRFPRQDCAALLGDNWLQWLKQNDPKQFDWVKEGKVLIQAPYAPQGQPLPEQQIKSLIHALKKWVR
ncbi:MAG: DUF4381 domain-containing protein [Parachlamydia sp.]|jgi:hypothetical protein|nr:DUF4381 domain-containing protein [Parachlamydia sp.]